MKFNAFETKDAQEAFRASLILTKPVQWRNPKQPMGEARLNDHSYKYFTRVIRGSEKKMVQVCHKAFLSIFGITNGRVQTVKTAHTRMHAHIDSDLSQTPVKFLMHS